MIIGDILFFSNTNPSPATLPLMIMGFLLIFTSFYIIFRLGFKLLRVIGFFELHRRWVIEFLAGSFFILIILQALGQLTFKDIAALVPVAIIGYFYYTYISSQKITD